MNELINKGKKAKEVSFILSNLSTLEKNKGLNAMANSLIIKKKYLRLIKLIYKHQWKRVHLNLC